MAHKTVTGPVDVLFDVGQSCARSAIQLLTAI